MAYTIREYISHHSKLGGGTKELAGVDFACFVQGPAMLTSVILVQLTFFG